MKLYESSLLFSFKALPAHGPILLQCSQARVLLYYLSHFVDYQQVISEIMSSGSSLSCLSAPHVIVDTMDLASDWHSLIGEIELYSYTNRSVSL